MTEQVPYCLSASRFSAPSGDRGDEATIRQERAAGVCSQLGAIRGCCRGRRCRGDPHTYRALAVLLVIIGHTHQAQGQFFGEYLLGDWAFFGFAGVDVFFVISGFIIHHLYRQAYGPDAGYFLKRINRISIMWQQPSRPRPYLPHAPGVRMT